MGGSGRIGLARRPIRFAAVRALVTGGRGFVGRWLESHLRAEGDDVTVIDHEVEVTDGAAVHAAVEAAAPDVVYHLAAITHVGHSWDDPDAVFKVNALGTLHVLEAARRCRPMPRVLLVSSAEVYGAVPSSRLPVGESAPLAPVTPYAVSKVAAEYLGIQAQLAHGLPVVRARPFNHIGPGQSENFVVPALAQRMAAAISAGEKSIRVGNLSARRDLTDVRDVVRAYRLMAMGAEAGEVYNVCRGTTLTVAEVAQRMLDMASADLELVTDPALVRPVDVAVVCGDRTRIGRALGWEPVIDLDTTLSDVLGQYRTVA